jgi:hypothetical protein
MRAWAVCRRGSLGCSVLIRDGARFWKALLWIRITQNGRPQTAGPHGGSPKSSGPMVRESASSGTQWLRCSGALAPKVKLCIMEDDPWLN